MGNDQTFGYDPTIDSKQLDTEENYKIFESPGGQEYEKYIILNDGSPNFQNNYEFRIENKHPNMVDIIYAGPSKNNFGCAEITKYEIVTERMPYRLNNLSAIQPPNALIILRATLAGFKDIFKKHGLISVKDNMIGINNHNRVKVWLNHNFSINNPEQKPISLQNLQLKEHERQMVHNIFDLINSKTQHQQLWSDLIHLKQAKNPTSFDGAMSLLDYYLNSKHVNIGEEVHNLFHKNYFHQSSEKGNMFVREEQSYLISDKGRQYPQVFRANSQTFQGEITPKFIKQNDNYNSNNQRMVINNQNQHFGFQNNGVIQQNRNQLFSQPQAIFQRPPQIRQMHQNNVHSKSIDIPRNQSPNIVINRLNGNQPAMQSRQPAQQNIILPQQGKISIKFNNNGPVQPVSFPKVVNIQPNYPSKIPIQQKKTVEDVHKKAEEVFVEPIETLIQFDQINADSYQEIKEDKKQTIVIASPMIVASKVQKQVISAQIKKPQQIEKNIVSILPKVEDSRRQGSAKQNDIVAILPKIQVEDYKQAIQSNTHSKQPVYSVQINQIHSEQSIKDDLNSEVINEQTYPQYHQDKQEIVINQLMANIRKGKEQSSSSDNSSQQNIQMLKTVVNASLIDTKEIKRQHPLYSSQKEMSFFKKSNKDVNRISYKSMREMLLKQLND